MPAAPPSIASGLAAHGFITAARGTTEHIGGVEFVQADLTTAEGGEMLAKAALERLGGIDILAHVIGGSSSPGGGFVALTDEHLLAELNLNLLATVRLDRLLLPQMIERGAGAVVHVTSAARSGSGEGGANSNSVAHASYKPGACAPPDRAAVSGV